MTYASPDSEVTMNVQTPKTHSVISRAVSFANDRAADYQRHNWRRSGPFRGGMVAVMPCLKCMAGSFVLVFLAEVAFR